MNNAHDPILIAQLFSSVSQIAGVGPSRAKLFKNLGITTIRDLLLFMPIKILSRKINPSITNISQSDRISKEVTVKKVNFSLSRVSKRPSKIICEANGQVVELTYFHSSVKLLSQQYIVGQQIIVSGEAIIRNDIIEIIHPTQVVPLSESYKINQFEPIYPATSGLNSRFIHIIVKKVLAKLPTYPEWLPSQIIRDRKWLSFKEALQVLHNPKNLDDVNNFEHAKQRLAFDEILCHQLKLQELRTKAKKVVKSPIEFTGNLKHQMFDNLSFKLTNSQLRVINDIENELKQNVLVSRLIQGDVGAGKTIVALALMLDVIEGSFQVALMAPTEILAAQHYKTICNFTNNLNIKCKLLTGSMTQSQKRDAYEAISTGEVDIIIGTHALFQQKVIYKCLRLVVIDEQHRFGVQQREQLQSKGIEVDLIMMTATPIPRTLEMVNYGDMDVSIIDQKPQNRKEIITSILSYKKVEDLENSLQDRISKGEKVFWVCPLIEETEKLDLAHVEARYESLGRKFNNLVGLVHGRMKKAKIDEEMQKFLTGEYKIIVATTVIEVGVDVPDATIMILENAERFGLSQLHQLRGRVGRGMLQSYCILIYGRNFSKMGQQRLQILKKSTDGFYIAEEDLKLRGAGDIVGTKQSGMLEFKIFDPTNPANFDLLNTAFNLAKNNYISSYIHLGVFS